MRYAIRNTEKNIEILIILNKYKDILNYLDDSLDEEFQNQLRPIDKGSYKVFKFESSSKDLLEGKDILNRLS